MIHKLTSMALAVLMICGRQIVVADDADEPDSRTDRYFRVPVILRADEITDDQVFDAISRQHPVGNPMNILAEKQRERALIVKAKVFDYLDPPRVFPLIGPAQVHHYRYRCTVYRAEDIIGNDFDSSSIAGEIVLGTVDLEHSCFHMVDQNRAVR